MSDDDVDYHYALKIIANYINTNPKDINIVDLFNKKNR